MRANVSLSSCAWMACMMLLHTAAAADAQSAGQALFEKHECGSCHATSRDAADVFDPAQRSERRGPALDHAGVKFRQEWVVQWLQEPTQIRPAGAYPPAVTKAGAGNKDKIDEAALAQHPALSAQDAAGVAEYLATLQSGSDRVAGVDPKPMNLPKKMAALNFAKFKGCIACHRDGSDHGGVSGPELYTAWTRATPEYLFTYIQDPSSWDRHTMMPGLALNDVEIKKLLGYLKTISGGAK